MVPRLVSAAVLHQAGRMVLGFAVMLDKDVCSKIHHGSSPLAGVEEAEKTPHASL